MLVEINKSKDIMISQILKGLNGNIQLPVCIKSIHYLRQTDRFSEEQLRVNFLMVFSIIPVTKVIFIIIFTTFLGS